MPYDYIIREILASANVLSMNVKKILKFLTEMTIMLFDFQIFCLILEWFQRNHN